MKLLFLASLPKAPNNYNPKKIIKKLLKEEIGLLIECMKMVLLDKVI